LSETEAAITAFTADSPTDSTAFEGELGDLLFSVVNLCRFFSIEPSVALQRTNIKFTERFKHVEKRMKETGQEMNAGNLAVMDRYWNEAKKV
jgi:tetrapyrrole methylase family protein/MazG family protein